MKTNPRGIDLIKSFESLRLKPYLCPSNIPTIGWGATTYSNGMKVQLTDAPITVQHAEDLLRHHLAKFEEAVSSAITSQINENQFSALVSFAYNVGQGAFKTSTLVKLINKGDKQGAADQFLRWTKAGGKELPGLVKRRKAERDLFLLPVIPSESELHDVLKQVEDKVLG